MKKKILILFPNPFTEFNYSKFEIPKLGSIVRITFDNGNYYQPVYHENIYPSDETKAEVIIVLESTSLKPKFAKSEIFPVLLA